MSPAKLFGGINRSWLRRVALVLGGLLALTALAWGGSHLWASHRLEQARLALRERAGGTTPAELAPPPVPDADNAYLPIRSSGVLLEDLGEGELELGTRLASLPVDAVPEPEAGEAWAEVRRRRAEAFELLHGAARRPSSSLGLDYDDDRHPIEGTTDLLPLVRQARMLAADARMALAEGPGSGRFQASLAALQTLSETLHREPLLITQLLAQAADVLLLRTLAAAAGAIPPGQADALLVRMPADPRPHLQRAFHMEAARTPGLVRSLPRGEAGGGVLQAPLVEVWIAEAVDVQLELARSVDLTRSERRRALERQMEKGGWGRPFHSLLIPNYLDALEKTALGEASRRLVRVGLELVSRSRRTGSYPASLHGSGLALELLRDPTSGGKMVWDLRPDGSARLAFPDARKAWEEILAPGADGGNATEGEIQRRRRQLAPVLELQLPPPPEL